MNYFGPIFPYLRIKVGVEVKKEGETLSWEVIELDDHIVVLRGPGGCKGRLVVTRDELNQKWGRA